MFTSEQALALSNTIEWVNDVISYYNMAALLENGLQIS